MSGTGRIWEEESFDADPAAQARRCLEIVVAVAALLDLRWRVEIEADALLG